MTKKLVLGTVQLGLNYGINNQSGKPSIEKAFDILNTAFDNGIQILDTAEAYGDSQEIIGEFLKSHPQKSFNIITKLAANSNVNKHQFIDHIKTNCDTLHVESLYGYMFHNYDSFKERLALYNELLIAREKKIINKAGISLYTNNEIEDILNQYSEFDFIQMPFNLFDNASKRQELLERAREKKIEIHTRSVFLQGLFFKKRQCLPEKLKPFDKYLSKLESLKERYNFNTETLALQYVLQKKYIDHVLIGVETSEQLLSNILIGALNKQIPHEVIDNIDIKEIELLNPSNWS